MMYPWYGAFRSSNGRLESASSEKGPVVAVTSSKIPYLYDLPHLLSLPPGFEFRFRYHPDWVGRRVSKAIQDPSAENSLLGQQSYLVFHSRELECLLPVRKATIIEGRRLGPMYYIRFRLGGFPVIEDAVVDGPDSMQKEPICPEDLESKRDVVVRAQLAEWNKIGQNLVGVHSRLGEPLKTRLHLQWYSDFSGETGRWSKQDAERHWANTVALAMKQPGLRAIPMFYIKGMRRDRYPKPDQIDPEDLAETRHSRTEQASQGFKLIKGKRYQLRLLQWRREDRPRCKITCESRQDFVFVEGTTGFVAGKYDVFDFTIKATESGFTEFLISVEQSDAEPERSLVAPQDDVQVGRHGGDLQAEGGVECDRERGKRACLDAKDPNSKYRGRADAEEGEQLDWPRLYSTRIPIKVRVDFLRTTLTLLCIPLGGTLWMSPDIFVSLTPISTPPDWLAGAVALLGIAVLAIPYGAFLTRVMRTGRFVEGTVKTMTAQGGN